MTTTGNVSRRFGSARAGLRRGSSALLTVVLVGGVLGGAPAPAQAASHALFAAPTAAGTGDCSSVANACAITTAVTTANALPSGDTVQIELAGGTYAPATTPTALPITAPAPDITFAAAAGASPVLDGTSTTRLLSVAAGVNVAIDGVAFQNGKTTGLGGAIVNNGSLTVSNATFSGNTGSNGGAISSSAGSTLAVRDSTFSANTATAVGGGALIVFGTGTVVRSALLDNTAPVNGGATNVQPGGTLTVSRSTYSGNTSGGLGGAMSNLGTTTVQGSTIVGNSATSGSVIATGNTDVSFAADIFGPQLSGAACNPAGTAGTDLGYNLDTDGTCISDTSPATGSHAGTTAYGSSTYGAVLAAYLADAAANNGGPSKTFALLNAPSPATSLANPAFNIVPPGFAMPVAIGGQQNACAMADQRGVTAAAGANCTIGAYLLQSTATTLAGTSAIAGQPVTWTATVAPTPDGGTVAFDDGAGGPATSQCAARPVVGGVATCTVTYADPGPRTATASYSGDGTMNNFTPSVSASANVTVSPVPPPTQTFTLSVTKGGAGSGTVTSSPAGITCGTDCSESYTAGTTVTLTAAPAAGSKFTGWTGCTATSGKPRECNVTAQAITPARASIQVATKAVTATFAKLPSDPAVSSVDAASSSILQGTRSVLIRFTTTQAGTAIVTTRPCSGSACTAASKVTRKKVGKGKVSVRIPTRSLAVGRYRITVRVTNANGTSRPAHTTLAVRARPKPPFTG